MLSQYSYNPIKLSPEDTVSKAVGAMETKGIKEIVLKENSEFFIVDPHRILRLTKSGISNKTKLRSIMVRIPVLNSNQEIQDAIEAIMNSGLNEVLIQNGEDIEVVHEISLMKELIKSNLNEIRSRDIMTSNITTINQNEEIATAKNIMFEKNIEHLPVVNDSGELVGIITEKDLLEAVLAKDNERIFDTITREVSQWDTPVKNLMSDKPVTLKPSDEVISALDNNLFDSNIIIIDMDSKPIGIITPKDVLETKLEPKEGVYVNISGLQDLDGFKKKEVHAEIDRTVKKINPTEPIQRLTIYVKKYSEEEGRIKYSIRARLVTDDYFYTSSAWDWDIIHAIGMAMDNLERQVFKRKGKLEDKKKRGETF